MIFSPNKTLSYRAGLILLVLGLGVVILPFLISALFLWRVGELLPYAEVIQTQQKTGALFGPGVSIQYYPYKLQLAKARKSDILVLGSSRALPFHQEYFTKSFTNGAQGMVTLDQGQLILEELLPHHKPKAVLLVLDFWWFNPTTKPQPVRDYRYQQEETRINTTKLQKVLEYVFQGKLSLAEVLRVIALQETTNPYARYPNLGLLAFKTASGTLPDGSVFYGQYGLANVQYDVQFKLFLEHVQRQRANFEAGDHLSPTRVTELKKLIAYCKQNKIAVFAIVPPVSPTLDTAMAKRPKQFAYITEWLTQLDQFGIPIANVHHPSSIPTTDCEFEDGYHGSEVTYLGILHQLGQDLRFKAFWPYLKREKITKDWQANRGRTLIQTNPMLKATKEYDFLELGCKR